VVVLSTSLVSAVNGLAWPAIGICSPSRSRGAVERGGEAEKLTKTRRRPGDWSITAELVEDRRGPRQQRREGNVTVGCT
jgi:hypothetical protein